MYFSQCLVTGLSTKPVPVSVSGAKALIVEKLPELIGKYIERLIGTGTLSPKSNDETWANIALDISKFCGNASILWDNPVLIIILLSILNMLSIVL